MVRTAEALLETFSADSPSVLRSGGLGVRDLRRIAKTVGVDESTAGILVEVVAAAGLLGEESVGAHGDGPFPADRAVRHVAGDRHRRALAPARPAPG